ncbi:MAG TPA: hypothetical protein VLH10_23600 [Yinghuangia sp.]|uniref:hypothetical protein n=1 Tax=Yinghuangia sp. YIM S10712 TaxID=3436930 RepID=UPI002B5C39E3|nr:hypothetical protein [Yinghuangia sp.]
MTTDADDVDRRELLREYREFIKTRHPDRGGDPAEFVAGLVRYRALLSSGRAEPGPAKTPPTASETTVYRRGSLPVQVWRAIMERRRRSQNPRVQ